MRSLLDEDDCYVIEQAYARHRRTARRGARGRAPPALPLPPLPPSRSLPTACRPPPNPRPCLPTVRRYEGSGGTLTVSLRSAPDDGEEDTPAAAAAKAEDDAPEADDEQRVAAWAQRVHAFVAEPPPPRGASAPARALTGAAAAKPPPPVFLRRALRASAPAGAPDAPAAAALVSLCCHSLESRLDLASGGLRFMVGGDDVLLAKRRKRAAGGAGGSGGRRSLSGPEAERMPAAKRRRAASSGGALVDRAGPFAPRPAIKLAAEYRSVAKVRPAAPPPSLPCWGAFARARSLRLLAAPCRAVLRQRTRPAVHSPSSRHPAVCAPSPILAHSRCADLRRLHRGAERRFSHSHSQHGHSG